MIFVEGLDNTGKSTLVREIKGEWNLKSRPSIGNYHPPAEELLRQAKEEVYLPNPTLVSDRSRVISEYIYNPILKNRPCSWGLDTQMGLLRGFVNNYPHLIIWCTRPVTSILTAFAEREQLPGIAEHLPDLERAYGAVMRFIDYMFWVRGGSEIIQYNFETDTLLEVNQHVRDYLEEIKK